MTIARYPSLQEFITAEAVHLERRQLPRTPLLYVLQNDCVQVDGLWLEFGVYSATTINVIARYRDGVVHGFDSFEGLPENWRPGMPRGRYSRDGRLPDVSPNVSLTAGWFDETLPGFLATHPQPVAFLHVDCDLYSSTKTVLDALSDRFVPGTVIVFDELFNYPGYERHELKAFYEFLYETGIECEWIGIQGPIVLVPDAETERTVMGKFHGVGVVVRKAA